MTARVSRERIADIRANFTGAGMVDNTAISDLLATAEAYHDEHDRAERLAGVVERVAWRTARIVGAVSRDVIEPLPEGYDLEDLHAKLQTTIGIERADLAALVADLRALHKPRTEVMSGSSDPKHVPMTRQVCSYCGDNYGNAPYPCATVAILDRHAGAES